MDDSNLNPLGDPYAYLLITATIVLTVTGQLLAKSAMLEIGSIPSSLREIPAFVTRVCASWKIITAFLIALTAGFAWIGAVSRTDISFAYPFMALAIVLVLALSPLVFGEQVPVIRWFGVLIAVSYTHLTLPTIYSV